MRLLTITTLLLFSNVLLAQDTPPSTLLQADRGNLYVDMEDSTATVFMLNQNPHMNYPLLYRTEYLKRQPNGDFIGEQAKVIGGKTLHYTNPSYTDRWHKIRLKPAPKPYEAQRAIAEGHFHAALSDLQHEGILSHRDNKYSIICDSILRPDRHYKEHLPLVMAALMPIIEESAPILARRTQITEYISLHLRTLPSTEIRDSVRLLLSLSEHSAQASRMLYNIVVQRPDVFLQMMDEMPSYKPLFLNIATSRGRGWGGTVHAIKKTEGHTALKKEILRKHRREMASGIGALTLLLAGDALVIWGVVVLVKKL